MTHPLAPWPYPRWWAHRGAGKLAPENTLAAFRHGASFGYRAFECDVKLSADDVPFLLHDAELERTTPEAGIASARLWRELSQIDAGRWLAPQWAGEPPASLAAIAQYLIANRFLLDLEIKPTPGDEHRTGRRVGEAVRQLWAGQPVPPLLSSFQPEALRGAMETAPELPRALLLDTLWDGWWDVATELGVVAVITNWRLMDEGLLSRLHGAGWRALVYTVNEALDAARLLALNGHGVDGLITDAVDRLPAERLQVAAPVPRRDDGL